MPRVFELDICRGVRHWFFVPDDVTLPKLVHLPDHVVEELLVELHGQHAELTVTKVYPRQRAVLILAHAQLIHDLTEPMLGHCVCVHWQSRCLALEDALVSVVPAHALRPIVTVRADPHIRSFGVVDREIVRRALDDVHARCDGEALRHGIL